jgi:hypothetical protein
MMYVYGTRFDLIVLARLACFVFLKSISEVGLMNDSHTASNRNLVRASSGISPINRAFDPSHDRWIRIDNEAECNRAE